MQNQMPGDPFSSKKDRASPAFSTWKRLYEIRGHNAQKQMEPLTLPGGSEPGEVAMA